MPAGNVVHLVPRQQLRFSVEFVCTGCGARVFAAVKLGPGTLCLGCEWLGSAASGATQDRAIAARLRAAGLGP
jgi:hypothetical protein